MATPAMQATEHQIELMRLHASTSTQRQLGKIIGVSETVVRRWLKEHEINLEDKSEVESEFFDTTRVCWFVG